MENLKQMQPKVATLCFLYKNGQILLARKAEKHGKGCFNGFGGFVEGTETIVDCALRELKEETGGVVAKKSGLEKIAVVHVHNKNLEGEKSIIIVHVFLVYAWTGEVCNTKEMFGAQWFSTHKLPFKEMMPADSEWLPLAIRGKKIIAKAYLGPEQKRMLRPTQITPVVQFPKE